MSWVADRIGTKDFEIEPASSDASFRRYWRIAFDGQTQIVMDAPPTHEDCGRFADLARRFRAAGVNTPEVLAENRDQGFLLLSDLGSRVYLGQLRQDTADRLYGDALEALLAIQAHGPTDGLPAYDAAFLKRELGIFREWFLERHLGMTLDTGLLAVLDRVDAVLIENAQEQPQVCVHRDFHSRNLMLLDHGNPGVLDFQDAVIGPVTYDLVSLLKDCYVAWPAEHVVRWAQAYRVRAEQSGVMRQVEPERFRRWMDLMGVQRHLKVCGIFARLHIRDGKPQYLNDLPLTLSYLSEAAARYPELAELQRLLDTEILPRRACPACA